MDMAEGPLVLLVEDDPLLASIIARRFVAESLHVERAASGEEALQLLEKGQKPDLMLLDIHLPGMSGFDVLEKIRAAPNTSKLPVIVLSNFNGPEDVERSKSLGVLKHIQKVSLTPAEIVDVVREELNKGRATMSA